MGSRCWSQVMLTAAWLDEESQELGWNLACVSLLCSHIASDLNAPQSHSDPHLTFVRWHRYQNKSTFPNNKIQAYALNAIYTSFGG